MKRALKLIVMALITVFGITFAILNSAPVSFDYFMGRQEMPLSLCLSLAFALGFFLAYLLLSFRIIKLKSQLRRHTANTVDKLT